MANSPSLFWHDYETFGIDPQRDRPAQFAGVRTDIDFNIIGQPLVAYCKPPADYLPQPDSCFITGITPQIAEQRGICEAEFIGLIHQQFSQANTCVLGYNNIRFDDEVTRNALYRNFYDPYEREWKNGNSRWDLLDVVRAAKALRPEGIVWPMNVEENRPSFRLEELTKANGLTHEMAHDALSDVYATIAVAKLLKTAQPKLYQFLWQHRLKAEALNLLQLGQFKPVVHISGKYPSRKHCLAIVLPLCKHPTNANGVMVYDLSVDPEPMLSLSVEDIQHRIFTTTAELTEEGVDRIPLKTVHINKCPVLAPITVIKPEDAERLALDLLACKQHIETIRQAGSKLLEKLALVFTNRYGDFVEQDDDPDLAIYSGGFLSDVDRQTLVKIRALSPEQLTVQPFSFNDNRLADMLFRYRARNYPETLTAEEKKHWHLFCVQRLLGQQSGAGTTLEAYFARLQELSTVEGIDQTILQALQTFANEKMQQLGIKN